MVVYAIIDEKMLNDELPLYLAADLVRIPLLYAECVNIKNAARKLKLFEQRLLALEQRAASPQHVAISDWLSSMPNDGSLLSPIKQYMSRSTQGLGMW